jgi:4-hydroxy-3-polyprenylbenzoate decarboxylase
MAFDSFRDFVARLEAAGELKRVSQPTATELEITELADREMKSPNGGKALLFEKPTVNGEASPFPLAINTMGSARRMAMSLGANSIEEIADEMGALIKAKPPSSFKEALGLLGTALELRHAKPKLVKSGPCKDVIKKFDAPQTRSDPWPSAPDWRNPSTFELRPSTLLSLPVQKCWPLDGGRFITLPWKFLQQSDGTELLRDLGGGWLRAARIH